MKYPASVDEAINRAKFLRTIYQRIHAAIPSISFDYEGRAEKQGDTVMVRWSPDFGKPYENRNLEVIHAIPLTFTDERIIKLIFERVPWSEVKYFVANITDQHIIYGYL